MWRIPSLVLTTALSCGALLMTTEPALAQHGHGGHGHGGQGGHGGGHGGHGYGGHGYGGHGHYYPYASFGFGLSVYPGSYYAYPRYYPAYDPIYYGSTNSGVYSSAVPAPRLVAPANGNAGIEVWLPDPEAQV